MKWSEGYHNICHILPPLFDVVLFDPRFLVDLVLLVLLVFCHNLLNIFLQSLVGVLILLVIIGFLPLQPLFENPYVLFLD